MAFDVKTAVLPLQADMDVGCFVIVIDVLTSVQAMDSCCNVGVTLLMELEKVALYCRYLPERPTESLLVSVVNAVQVPSGMAVLPALAEIASVVPVGVEEVQFTIPQLAEIP